MKKVARILVLVLVLAVVGYFVYQGMKKKDEAKAEEQERIEQAKSEGEVDATVPVKVVPVVKGDLPLRLTISAVSDARERAPVRCEVEGTVVYVARREGAKVNKGDVIVKLESSERQLALKEAEAAHLKAYSEFITKNMSTLMGVNPVDENRIKELENQKKQYQDALAKFRRGEISKEELEKSESKFLENMLEGGALQEEVKRGVSNLTQQEVALERARYNLERTVIRAPFSGVVSEVKVSVGERVSAGTEIFRIINLQSVYLKGYILETELGKVQPGMDARIRFLSYPDTVFRGRVSSMAPEIDLQKKTGTVFIEVKNPGNIYAGMEAEVDIEYRIVRDILKVPVQAMLVREGRPLIFIIRDDIAMWEYVETGSRNDEEVEVRPAPNFNFQEGEEVAVEGLLTLAHQAKVRVVR